MKSDYCIVICDDDEYIRDSVRELLTDYAEKNGFDFNVTEFKSGEEFLQSPGLFSILILDIDLPGINGIETAENYNSMHNAGDYRIIMLSGLSGRWVKEAYRTRALRYVSKPIEETELFEALNAVIAELDTGVEINVMSGSTRCLIRSGDICYAKSGGDYSKIYTKDGIYDKSCSLNELLREVGPLFYIPHRSCLINLKYVRTVTDKCIEMKNGETLPYARRKKKELIRAFLESRFGK